MSAQEKAQPQLKKSLKTRHLSMISLGGVIGAGLFVGSSATISATGPGAFITYAITGLIVMLIMRMLGEMVAAHPTTGSFIEYARLAFGDWAGFSTGWMYWYFWVIVVGFEAVVGGQIINGWLPHIPVWVIALALLIIMTAVNCLSVASFGEAEYWFAGIKIVAIILFLLIAGSYTLGLWPDSKASLSNLTAHGGMFPKGILTLFSGVVIVIFSMTGVEVAAIAAAESEDPARNVRKAVNTVMFRIMLFFVLSTFLIVVIQPWTSITPGQSPFVKTLQTIGIPGSATILTAVILVAVLSVLNAGLYTSSRLLFVLSHRKEAPEWMGRINRRGVPVRSVLASTLVGYACVIIARTWPDTVFLFLINSSGAVFLFVYLMICLSQIRLRKRLEQQGALKFRMWGHPWLALMVTASIIAVLASMLADPATRLSLLQSCLATVFILFAFGLLRLYKSRATATGNITPEH